MMIGKTKKKKKGKSGTGDFEDEEDEVMMAQMAAKGAGVMQITMPSKAPLVEFADAPEKPPPEESEEWKKFNALLSKTQDNVQQTQEKITKLAETSAVQAPNKSPFSLLDSDLPTPSESSQASNPFESATPASSTATPKVVSTAATPIAPSSSASKWMAFDDDAGAFGENTDSQAENTPEVKAPPSFYQPQAPPLFSEPLFATKATVPSDATAPSLESAEAADIPDVFDTSKFSDSSTANPFASATEKKEGSFGEFGSGAASGQLNFDPFALLDANRSASSAINTGAGDEFDPFATKSGKLGFDDNAVFSANFGGKSRPAKQKAKKTKGEDEESDEGSEYNCDIDPDEERKELKPFHEPYHGQVWQMGLRTPSKKTKVGPIGSQRGWKTTYARLEDEPKHHQVFVRLYSTEAEAAAAGTGPRPPVPIAEVKLEPHMTLSSVAMQPFDEYGKVYTTKIYHTDYKERPGFRIDKAAPKGLFHTSIKDLKRIITKPKATTVLDHAPVHDEIMKLGSLNADELRDFRWCFEDAMMRVITRRRETTTKYTKDEVTAKCREDYVAVVDKYGHIVEQKARVRLFCLAFLSGMPFVEFGLNDFRRKGKEIVRRTDIIPMKTEQWIRVENYEFHSCVDLDAFERQAFVRFQPPDGINVEILRFRVRPPRNFQLPLQVKATMNIDRTNRDIDLRMEVIIPGYFSNSRKANQAPCENIAIAFPIPEPWLYYFRVEHVWGIGSVHATKSRPGKIKGFERLTNLAQNLIPHQVTGAAATITNAVTGVGPSSSSGGAAPKQCHMEVNTGECKYEALYNGIVWRIPRLPERFQGAYKTHLLQCRIPLGTHDPIPDKYDQHISVEYTIANTLVSRAVVRSISISGADEDDPPDKWVKQHGTFFYRVEIDYTNDVRHGNDADIKPVKTEPIQAEGFVAGVAGAEAAAAAAASGEAAAAPAPPSDKSSTSSEDEDDAPKPRFNIQLNPAIASFIQQGGAISKPAAPPPAPIQSAPTNKETSSPMPQHKKEEDSSSEEEEKPSKPQKAESKQQPPRPQPPRPPPRPAAPASDGHATESHGGAQRLSSSSSSGNEGAK